MQTQALYQPADYARVIAALVAKMPVERAAQVYDFVRFLQDQPLPTPLVEMEGNDCLSDSEEQMQMEDAQWEATFTLHREQFATLGEAARAEIAVGATQPMFDEDGEFALR
jgi:hypothetical protein